MYKSIVRGDTHETPSPVFCRIQHLSWEDLTHGFVPGKRAKRSHVPPHSHPFWQLEFVAQGRIRAEADGRAHLIPANAALLIPPGMLHRFWYEEPHAFLSIKFTLRGATGDAAHRVEMGSLSHSLLTELAKLLDRECEVEQVEGRLPLADQLLSCLVVATAERGVPEPAQTPRDPLARLYDLVLRKPELAARVGDLAKELKKSPGHLSSLFRKKHGTPLKAWLDRARAEAAASRLAWSDHSIGEISRRLGFPDPLTFSHFFRRVKGMGPREWRKRAAPLS
jgi:AraC-like DNA-binding protein